MSHPPVKPSEGKANHLLKGALAEAMAKDYLHQQGLELLHERFSTSLGEIDLIMKDKTVLVFVEVRSRGESPWVDPLETITPRKQRRIILTAQCYLQSQPHLARLDCRFDVVAILGDFLNPEITWIPDAFQVK